MNIYSYPWAYLVLRSILAHPSVLRRELARAHLLVQLLVRGGEDEGLVGRELGEVFAERHLVFLDLDGGPFLREVAFQFLSRFNLFHEGIFLAVKVINRNLVRQNKFNYFHLRLRNGVWLPQHLPLLARQRAPHNFGVDGVHERVVDGSLVVANVSLI